MVVDDVILTSRLDKSSPKLQEKCLKGEVIPKLEIEQTATSTSSTGQEPVQVTYLKYTLTNVLVTSVNITATAAGGDTCIVSRDISAPESKPVTTTSVSFETIAVT